MFYFLLTIPVGEIASDGVYIIFRCKILTPTLKKLQGKACRLNICIALYGF